MISAERIRVDPAVVAGGGQQTALVNDCAELHEACHSGDGYLVS